MYVYTRLQRFSSTASAIRKHMTHHSSRPKYIITKSQPPKLPSPNVLFYSAYHTPPVAAALICSKAFLSHTLSQIRTHFLFTSRSNQCERMYACAFAFRYCNSKFFTILTSKQRKFSHFSLFQCKYVSTTKRYLCYQIFRNKSSKWICVCVR